MARDEGSPDNGRHNKPVIYTDAGRIVVRLEIEDKDLLLERAKARGLAPATLAREWILDRLRNEENTQFTR